MDPRYSENPTNNRASSFSTLQASPIVTPSSRNSTSYPSNNTSNSVSPQRSVRLSNKSPRKTSLSSNEASLHRTISGGVANSHSPKLNVRKRTSGSTDVSGLTNSSITYSTITSNNNGGSQASNNNNNNSSYQHLLPADQSDDEEIISNKNVVVRQTSTGLLTRSQIVNYFIKQDNGYKCKLCNNVYQATKRSDANLRKHLSSTAHKIPNVLFLSQVADDSTESQISIISTDRKRQLDTAAVSCIVLDGLSFGAFRQPGMSKLLLIALFRAFCKTGMSKFLQIAVPGYAGPHRRTVRRKIAALYSSYTKRLRSVLSQAGLLSLTCDLWKSSQRIYYISLTGHICTGKYENISLVLGCRRIIGRHLSTNVQKYIEFELRRLHIKPEQIISITTDNGSEMKKATSTFKFGARISCMAHNLNLVVKHGLCLWKEPKSDDFPLDFDTDCDEWEDLDDLDDDGTDSNENSVDVADDLVSDEDEEDSDNDDDSNQGDNTDLDQTTDEEFESESDDDINFSALTINTSKPSGIDHYDLLIGIFYLMKKTRAGVKFIRNHNITNDYMIKYIQSKYNNKNVGRLVLDMAIRWNSSYLLLDRLLMHKDIDNSLFSLPNNLHGLTEKQKKKFHELAIKQNEWELIHDIKQVLEPFLAATTVLSAQRYPTMGAAFYVWRLLQYFLNSTINDQPIVIALKESLRFRFNIYCNKKLPPGQLDTMKLAAFLDPTIYNLLSDDDRKSAKKLIFKRLNDLPTSNIVLPSSSTSTTTTTSTITKSSALQKLALLCGHNINLTTSTASKRPMTIDEELSAYIEAARSATSFQEFWVNHHKSLPRLVRLVRRVCIIPASSVASERLFSIGSFLNRKQRSSLSSQTLRYLLVLKDQHILDKLQQDY